MAKHAKRKKTKTKSRRRMSGGLALNPASEIVQYGSIGVGFLLGDKINAAIDNVADPTKIDGKLVAGAQVGAGAAYMWLKKGKKNLPLTIASGLLIGSGAKRAMKVFGLGAMPLNSYQNMKHVAGYQDVHHVAALSRRNGVGAYNPSKSGMGFNAQRIPIGSNATIFRNRMRA